MPQRNWPCCCNQQSIPHECTNGYTGKAVGKTSILMVKLKHLVLELPVGHSCRIAVDYAKVGLADFLSGGVAVDAHHVEHEALVRGVPLHCLVFLLCILLLDVI